MSKLFTALKIRNVNTKNRIGMPPMCQYSASNGYVSDWHLVHYGARAAGGAGLIIQEATAVVPEGRITPGDLGIWSDDHIPGLRKIVNFIEEHGSVPAIQLAHAGRKASCDLPWNGGKQLDLDKGGWLTKAPSDLPFSPGERKPDPLDMVEIEKIINSFKAAAERALKAGYRIIEIHSAHGYLLQEFMSPLSNCRTDEYGGSFENRIRLLLKVIQAVKTVWPEDNPLFVRISSTEWREGGWTLEDSTRLAGILMKAGVDLLDCSSGGNIHDAKIPFAPEYQVPFSEAVKKTGMPSAAVGLITNAAQGEQILTENKADLVLYGRELLRNPYFPLYAARELGAEINWPLQYLRSK